MCMLSHLTTRCSKAFLRTTQAPALSPHCVQAPFIEEQRESTTARVSTVAAQPPQLHIKRASCHVGKHEHRRSTGCHAPSVRPRAHGSAYSASHARSASLAAHLRPAQAWASGEIGCRDPQRAGKRRRHRVCVRSVFSAAPGWIELAPSAYSKPKGVMRTSASKSSRPAAHCGPITAPSAAAHTIYEVHA